MKDTIQNLIQDALIVVAAENNLTLPDNYQIKIEQTRDASHGDYACNIAMMLAKQVGMNPRELAEKITRAITANNSVNKIELAGPGFINFFLNSDAHHAVIPAIFEKGKQFGMSDLGKDKTVLLEFVSANPTGPLHIGHGRGAAYGATVANLLRAVGFNVSCEYYINDAGRQMDILAISVWLRYLQLHQNDLIFPDNAYQGEYIFTLAEQINQQYQAIYTSGLESVSSALKETDPEKRLDKIIQSAKESLDIKGYGIFFQAGLDSILSGIKNDLEEFGVNFENWFSEKSLLENNTIDECLDKLSANDWIYEKDGAKWFASSRLNDEKDRVLIRDNGIATYFTSDIAYHQNKYNRGFDKIINIWGADHHGYIARVKAAINALGLDESKLEILLVQFATLYRGKEKLQMSTRSGEFITLNQLQDEVGRDAARFFYILRKSEQHLDFDLELAKSESNDNPVYYIQYAHARICSVFRQLNEKDLEYKQEHALNCLEALTESNELKLMATLTRYPEIIQSAALNYEPHVLAYYLRDLANEFHGYYNASQFIVENEKERNARLALVDACKQVLFNGLEILGVTAPEKM